MEAATLAYIGMALVLVLLFLGMPIGIAMGVIGIAGMVIIVGWDAGIGRLGTVPFRTFNYYDMVVVPLFVLMGMFCFYSKISGDLYDAVYKWLGHLPGGIGITTIGATAFFSAVSGSSVACAATMGVVALKEMKRYNYDPALATGCVAAGATLDILIPPSVVMVLYGLLTEQSIGKLFIAGIIPGIILSIFYIMVILVLCKRNPLLGPPGGRTSFTEKVVSLKSTWAVLLLFLLVMGGLYFGVFTPTEAGGIGAFGAFIFALATRRLDWKSFRDSLTDSAKTTGMIFTILVGAMFLICLLAVSEVPYKLASIIGGLPVSRYMIMTAIIIVYIFLGCIMDTIGMILLTVPIFFPVIVALGFDPIWFGVIIVMMAEIALITPPVGVSVYIIKGIAKDIPMGTIFRGIFPFFVADLVFVVLMVIFPQIALVLPNTMK